MAQSAILYDHNPCQWISNETHRLHIQLLHTFCFPPQGPVQYSTEDANGVTQITPLYTSLYLPIV